MGDFFRDTHRKIIRRQRQRAQSWFVKHPITFGAVWGLKALSWDVPKWGINRLSGVKTVKERKPGGETVTVVEHMDANGDISTTTITREKDVRQVADGPRQRKTPTTVSPAERMAILKSSKALLTRTPLGRAFLLLAGEIDGFAPVRGAEAISTVEMIHQASRGFARISMGVEAFADAVAACGMHRSVTNPVNNAAFNADALAKGLQRTYTTTLGLYEGQINQDMSGAASVAAVPVPAGTGDEAAGIWPYSSRIADYYGMFSPTLDQEATEVFAFLGISQAGFALISDMLGALPAQMSRHGIDKRVTRLVRSAAGTALETAESWSKSRKVMARLYQGQLHHEASGVTTIRTAPLKYTNAA